MKLGVMQPYFFPYLGYFQLIRSVDRFVFYDDVSYIKQGWINRNNILLNGTKHLFTVPVKDISSFRSIRETELHPQQYAHWRSKWLKTVRSAYQKAPHYSDVFPMIADTMEDVLTIGELAKKSIVNTLKYTGLHVDLVETSGIYNHNVHGQERILQICRQENASVYINAIGGKELYDREEFKKESLDLFFIKPRLREYRQFGEPFVPGLSMVDILMFNNQAQIAELLNDYTLE